jgi:hypothetical protein
MAVKRPRIVSKPFTNKAYGGYGSAPRGSQRRVKPIALLVLHITGNARTAKMPDGVGQGSGARAEWSYANRSGSSGPSAHNYVARNGATIQAIDAAKYAAWSNGDLTNPYGSVPVIGRMVRQAAKGINPNELVLREVECLGAGTKFRMTAAQKETVAFLLARDSIRSGLPIKAGETVAIHAWINTVNRSSCPFPSGPAGDRRALEAICARARAIKAELTDPGPDPDPEPPDDLEKCEAKLSDALDRLEAATGYAEKLEGERTAMLGAFARIGRIVAPYEEAEQ